MSYIDGFLIAVETARRDEIIEFSRRMDAMFLEYGATRVVECWGDDVPDGTLTDFRRAVQAKDGEEVMFSWIEWPDKATRDAGMAKSTADGRMMAEPMPFDGKRMIFGGFTPVVVLEK
ncbi:DUF1428 domain-containing protein [uncultured Sphingomonas sp.]|uniref:DUF1428 domain-containing protein n=1 Tax=uncultured Sphingomonas sp. TaxID=158754 RepID=UPI0035CAB0CE